MNPKKPKDFIKPTAETLELSESLEQLRVLENGYNIKLVEIKKETFPVDTISDLKNVSKVMKQLGW